MITPRRPKSVTWYDALYFKLVSYSNTQPVHNKRFEAIELKIYEAVQDAQEAARVNTKNSCRADTSKTVDDNGLPLNIKTPSLLVLTNVISLSAYLASIFAFQRNVFTITDYLPKLWITDAVKGKLGKDSSNGRWSLQMLKACNNAATFNFGPMLQRLDSVAGSIVLEALCPYNTHVDPSVPTEDVGARAGYAYTTKLLNIPELFSRLKLMQSSHLTPAGTKFLAGIATVDYEALASTQAGFPYIEPPGVLDKVTTNANSKTDWQAFSIDKPKRVASDGIYASGTSVAVTQFYIRALPEWLGLPKRVYGDSDLTNMNAIPVYVVTLIGGSVLSVEPLFESHNFIPISVGSIRASTSLGIPPSFAELLIPSQDANTKFDNAKMAGIRRLFGRHGIYDGSKITAAELAKPLAKADIPKEEGEQQTPVGSIYKPTDFDGQGLSYLLGSMSDVQAQAARAVGNTPQMQGSRVPGNKLAVEAQKEVVVAEAPYRVYAMTFQETLVAAQRKLLRSNLRHLVPTMVYMSKVDGVSKKLTLKEFAEAEVDFEISDGLSPSSKLISPDAVNALVNYVASVPAVQAQFDLGTLFKILAMGMGFEDVNDVPAATQQQIEFQVLQALNSGAQAPVVQQGDLTAQAGVTDPTQGAQPPAQP